MLASLMRSVQERTGDGRVKHSDSGGKAGRDDVIKPGRKVGDGAQALAWGGVTFKKLPPPSASASTSPETDPGDSDPFPFFNDGETGGILVATEGSAEAFRACAIDLSFLSFVGVH